MKDRSIHMIEVNCKYTCNLILQLKMLRKTEENGFSTSTIYKFYGFYYFSNTKRASPIENVT